MAPRWQSLLYPPATCVAPGGQREEGGQGEGGRVGPRGMAVISKPGPLQHSFALEISSSCFAFRANGSRPWEGRGGQIDLPRRRKLSRGGCPCCAVRPGATLAPRGPARRCSEAFPATLLLGALVRISHPQGREEASKERRKEGSEQTRPAARVSLPVASQPRCLGAGLLCPGDAIAASFWGRF